MASGLQIHPTAEVDPGAEVGEGTRIWHHAQVREGARIGRACTLGKGVYVDQGVVVGDRVKIENGALLFHGLTVEDDVFIGPGVVFTNDLYPRARGEWTVVPTRVARGASIGANATIVCGVVIGAHALVGAGAVVTRDVPPYGLVVGNPARFAGRVDENGHPQRAAGEGEPARARNGRVAAPLRLGVIGAGQMGRHHIRAVSLLRPKVELAGVADPDPRAIGQVEEMYGIRCLADYRELLPRCDAAIVAVPTSLHHRVALDCLEAGLHVLVEKPMAATLAEAEEVVAAADRAGRCLLVGHVERFNPVVGELARALGDAGRLVAVHARRLSPFSPRGLDMDVVADLMLHDIDLVCSLTGSPVRRCQAAGLAVHSERTDYAVANLVLESGAVATLVASRATHEKVRLLEVTTEGGYFALDFLDRKLLITRDTTSHHDQGVYRQSSQVETISVPNVEPLVLEVAHFAACARGLEPPRVKGAEALEVLRIVAEIQGHVGAAVKGA